MTDAEHLKEIQEEWKRKLLLYTDYDKQHKMMTPEETEKWLEQARKEEARRVD